MRLKTNPEMYFHQALGIAQEFPPYNKLTNKERQVLGEIMLAKHLGWKPTLNPETRKLIPQKLEISIESFRNILTALRDKGLLENNEVPEKHMIKYLQAFNFEFYE